MGVGWDWGAGVRRGLEDIGGISLGVTIEKSPRQVSPKAKIASGHPSARAAREPRLTLALYA